MLLALGGLALAAAPSDDPFALANAADAPGRAPEPKAAPPAPSRAPEAPAKSVDTEAVGKAVDAKPPKTAELIDFKVRLVPAAVGRGEMVELKITGKPRSGYHTYPITQRADNRDQSPDQLSKIVFDDAAELKPLYPIVESDPQTEDVGLGPMLVYNRAFTWSQKLFVPTDLAPGKKVLRFHIRLQVCDERQCTPGSHRFEVPLTVTEATPVRAAPPSPESLKPPDIKVVSLSGGGPPKSVPVSVPPAPSAAEGSAPAAEAPAAVPIPDTAEEHRANLDAVLRQMQKQPPPTDAGLNGLLAFALQGAAWGLISLLTPCVFPMIPITVSFFLKQSEKEHHRPLGMALVYSGTIIVVLTIAAVALLSFFRWLSVNPFMNFALGALFVYFALSLFGMYDIQLPSFLTQYTASRESQGGMVGTVFMALTFTLVSFACVAPFLGGFGGTAAGSGITIWHRLLGGLAYATTFAAPFFVLALFPGLLRRLPRSGSWMNTVKVVMGFLELAAALKFFRAGELVLLPQPAFLTYDLALGVYVALSVLCGLYLVGVFRLPHDEPAESISVPRFVFALAFLSLALYLAPALLKSGGAGQNQRPNGTVYAWVDSFLLPDPGESKGDLAWGGNLRAAVDETRKAPGGRQLVFLDFTGETCTNCKLNERDVFPRPEVRDLLQRYRLVRLYTDKVPDSYYSAAVRGGFGSSTDRQRTDAAANLEFQRGAFGTEQLPLYAILEPQADGEIRVAGTYTEGKINDPAAFVDFLRKPLGGEAR
jgi:thiol:disulfide interchange protein DsbD